MAAPEQLAECVVNISEGRDLEVVDTIGAAGGDTVLDVHSDPAHHRSVITLVGSVDEVEAAARAVVAGAVELIDLRTHVGVHPRFGAADVVPFVTLAEVFDGAPELGVLLGARDRFARWAGEQLALPCFLYGPERSLPDVRRKAFSTLAPDTGPPRPHPSAGAAAVGARGILVAYNLWLAGPDDRSVDVLEVARSIAVTLRGPAIRALGLAIDGGSQVSLNLVDPATVSVEQAYDQVAEAAESRGCAVVRAELVGLVPAALLEAVPARRWAELDLSETSTIEHRLGTTGFAPNTGTSRG